MTHDLLKPIRLAIHILIFVGLLAPTCSDAQSVLNRLSGFDETRLTAAASWADTPQEEPLGREAAKLIYQVNRLARGSSLQVSEQASDSISAPLASVVNLNGQATKIDRWRLPEELADVMDFTELYRVEVVAQDTADPVVVITSVVPNRWLRDGGAIRFPTSVTGVLIRRSDDSLPAVIAAPSLAWLAGADADAEPDDVPAGWLMLGRRGFDVALLEGVRARNRQPLREEDAAAFYPLLRIASSIGQPDDSANENRSLDAKPTNEPAADLLRDAENMVGRYINIDLQTIRVTRINVTESTTKQQLGSDHYWQLDAIGDLGNVVIKIESGDGESATFENRYPVSVAIKELPPFLLKAISSSDPSADAEMIDVAMISTQVSVDGFFYRLWSYESDFMNQHGGGKQFGPLIIASRIIDREPARTDAVGVSRLGWYFAALVVFGILAAMIGGILSSRRDSKAKQRARASLPDRIVD